MIANYLSICAIFRDEAPYLEEWLEFHQLMGVEHFYLYDNDSSDDASAVLQPFIDAGIVSLQKWSIPFHQKAQRRAYAHCLETVASKTRWLAFIDLDEFLFAPGEDTLPDTLRCYEDWPGVVVHWQTYGSSGREEQSSEPVIERFTWRARRNWVRNRKVKSIVDPSRTVAPDGVHHFSYAEGELPVDETGRQVTTIPRPRYRKKLKRLYGKLGPFLRYIDPYSAADIDSREISVERLRINHYPVKSREEFLKKSVLKKEKRRYEDIDYFAYHDRNEVHDPVLHKYLPALRQMLEVRGTSVDLGKILSQ